MASEVVLSVDPGNTTGWVLVIDSVPDDHGEAGLDTLPQQLWAVAEKYDPNIVLMESVVASGTLNRDKVNQITASGITRAVAQILGIPLLEITPRETKWGRHLIGNTLLDESKHIRDAYTLVHVYRTMGKQVPS